VPLSLSSSGDLNCFLSETYLTSNFFGNDIREDLKKAMLLAQDILAYKNKKSISSPCSIYLIQN
jgi:hypothetical protein